MNSKFPVLEDDKIRLRALEPEDVALLYLWENDSDIWKVSGTQTPYSKYTLEQFVKTSVQDIYSAKQLRLMIDEVASGKTIGIIDVFDFDPFHSRAALGILIHKSFRNHSFAEMAVQKVKNYLFNTLLIHQIYCNVLVDNPESIRLFQKCGFQIIAQKKEWHKTPHGYIDELMLQLINH